MTMVEGEQLTDVLVDAWVTVTIVVPTLAALPKSPEYAAWTVGPPTPVPVKVAEHEPDKRAQPPEDTPPGPRDVEKATVPVGEAPVTAAVHDVVAPMANDAGRHVTVVIVIGRADTGLASARNKTASSKTSRVEPRMRTFVAPLKSDRPE